MRKFAAMLLVLFLAAPALAGDFDFLAELNVSANADLGIFKGELSTRFGVHTSSVDVVIRSVDTPADAYMVFKMCSLTNSTPERVLSVYKAHKGKGWGAIAKEMGIKPGSDKFMELKRGEKLGKGGDKPQGGGNSGSDKGGDSGKDKGKGGK